MPQSHDDNDGLKLITTLKGDCVRGRTCHPHRVNNIEVRSATGKMKGNIYFIDLGRPDEWLLCLPAKELSKLWSIMFDEN